MTKKEEILGRCLIESYEDTTNVDEFLSKLNKKLKKIEIGDFNES